MGFFDIFKKSVSTHEDKINNAYLCFKQDMVKLIFPKGKSQANKIINSLVAILCLNLNNCDSKKYYNLLTIYSDVLIRKVVTHTTDDIIISTLLVKHGDLIPKRKVTNVLAYCILNIKNNDYEIT